MFSASKAAMLFAIPLALCAASAARADTIIVRSNGPSAKSYPIGKSLPANTKLALQNGDSVTVLDAGGTRVFKGPGNFPLSAAVAVNNPAFGQFLRNTGARISRAGAVRGTNGLKSPLSPNIWFVDISKSGPVCVADPTSITLWRAQSANAQNVTLAPASGGKPATIAFLAGQASRGWPVADVPVTDGAQYTLSGEGMSGPVTITVRTVSAAPASLDAVGSLLIKNGCAVQTNLLVETAAQSGNGGGTGG